MKDPESITAKKHGGIYGYHNNKVIFQIIKKKLYPDIGKINIYFPK